MEGTWLATLPFGPGTHATRDLGSEVALRGPLDHMSRAYHGALAGHRVSSSAEPASVLLMLGLLDPTEDLVSVKTFLIGPYLYFPSIRTSLAQAGEWALAHPHPQRVEQQTNVGQRKIKRREL